MVRCNCIAYFFNTYWHSISQVDGIAWCGNGVLGHRFGEAYFWSLPWKGLQKGEGGFTSKTHSNFYQKDGDQFEQQNPKCKQFLLVATRQASENHGCTLCCVPSPPNPLVFFPMGQQSATRYLGVQDFSTVFGFESVVHVRPLQHVL